MSRVEHERDLPLTGRGWRVVRQRVPDMQDVAVKDSQGSINWDETGRDYPLKPALERKLAAERRREEEGRG